MEAAGVDPADPPGAKARKLWERFGNPSLFLRRGELRILTRFWQALKHYLSLCSALVVSLCAGGPCQQCYQADHSCVCLN
jgi:hypothetical protein